ncbi:MAG: hypothetical protein Q9163_001229 [Psora crenata]
MRGFLKAAALLSSNLACALVTPNAAALQGRPNDPILEYASSEASLKFVINTVNPTWSYPVLTFEVKSSGAVCGENNVKLNGQTLETNWTGPKADGVGFLEAYNAGFSFTISCLPAFMSPKDDSYDDGRDGIHVLSLQLHAPDAQSDIPGFTISYKQAGQPSIIRFQPSYVNIERDYKKAAEWKVPTLPFAADTQPPLEKSLQEATTGSLHRDQKNLQSHIEAIDVTLKDKVENFKDNAHKAVQRVRKACHRLKDKALKAIASLEKPCRKHSSKVDEAEDHFHKVADVAEVDGLASIANTSDDSLLDPHLESQVNTIGPNDQNVSPSPNVPATKTKSVNTIPPTASAASIPTSLKGVPSFVVLKSFTLALILLSFFSWLFLRCRDPRCRADRAARREERRNKRLYRRAARHQAMKNWFWSLRMKYCLANPTRHFQNEKHNRVITQESILGDLMKDDIRALRNAHRAVSSMTATAAEEGRAGFYDSEGEQRPAGIIGSVSTMPGYETDGSQPPPYDESRCMGGDMEEESTPDSSVISTSPRISRDGTNSDFEEKIEVLDLVGSGIPPLKK